MFRFELTTAVTSGYDETNFIGVQPAAFGTSGGSAAGMGAYQQLLPLGYYARPLDREDSGSGCLMFTATEGGRGYAWCVQDPRFATKCPPISKGSRALVNDRGAFLALDYDSETGTLYVPIQGGAKAHSVQIGYDSSATPKPCLNLVHANGMAVIMLDETVVIKNAAGDAYIELNADGVVVNGNTKLVGGLDVGGSGAQPVPSLPLFVDWWTEMVATVSAVPVYGSAIGAAMETMTSTLPGVGTTLLKGL